MAFGGTFRAVGADVVFAFGNVVGHIDLHVILVFIKIEEIKPVIILIEIENVVVVASRKIKTELFHVINGVIIFIEQFDHKVLSLIHI